MEGFFREDSYQRCGYDLRKAPFSVAAGFSMKIVGPTIRLYTPCWHNPLKSTAGGGGATFSCFVVIPQGSWDVSLRRTASRSSNSQSCLGREENHIDKKAERG
jgi:hypothetical protein